MLFYFLYFTGNDLDSIRALFSEKEKELSLAVAKVEALTRQLEELRRDRRGPLNLIPGGNNNGGANVGASGNQPNANSPAARELDKLRRELMVSIKLFDTIVPFYPQFSHPTVHTLIALLWDNSIKSWQWACRPTTNYSQLLASSMQN